MILNLIIKTQGLQLQEIKDNPGILPVKHGQAVVEKDKWTIVKILDFKAINDDLVLNINRYKEFSSIVDIHKPYANEFQNMKLQVEYLRNSTIMKFRQLIPSKRFKRGLIDPLGSIIKTLTGNLAHEDAIKYDTQISQLKIDHTHIDKKITIISKMFDSVTNKSMSLQENIQILDERMKRIERIVKNIGTKENNSIYSTYVLSMFDMFVSNFRTIYIVLNEIETALSFTKVSIVHQAIVDPSELLSLLNNISKTESLIYPVTEKTLLMLERTMSVKAYVKENQITFIMEIPLIDKSTYNYFKIYSLPILNENGLTTVIIPKYPYLMVKGPIYLPLASPCEEIAANQFLCKENDVVWYPESTCIEQLMNFASNLSLCKPVLVNLESLKVQPIDFLNWIIYTRNEIILTETCADDITRKRIKGTYILEITGKCSVYLKNIKLHLKQYTSGRIQYRVVPVAVLPKLKETSINWNKTVNLNHINFDDLKHLSYTLKSEIVKSESAVKTNSVSLATILLYVILVLICFSLVFWKKMSCIVQGLRNHRNPNITDNFALGEGGVMEPQPIQIVRMSA